MHQRICHVRKGLEQETFDSLDINEAYDDTGQIEHQINVKSIPTIKPGIKLPKFDYDWKLKNDFFSISLPVSDIAGLDINTVVSSMNSTIYDYFHEKSWFFGKYRFIAFCWYIQGLLYRHT